MGGGGGVWGGRVAFEQHVNSVLKKTYLIMLENDTPSSSRANHVKEAGFNDDVISWRPQSVLQQSLQLHDWFVFIND